MRNRSILAFIAAASLAASAHAGVSLNLVNPGAETGTGVDAGSTVSGWTVGGTSNPGRDDGTFDGFTPHSGADDFYGGSGVSGTLSQVVSLSGLDPAVLALIDAGTDTLNVEFFEQSLDQGTPSDAGEVKVTFQDASGTALSGGYDSGLIESKGGWQDVTGSTTIPAGARSATYEMIFTREQGSDLDSFIDDNSATVGSAPVVTTSVPLPASFYTGASLLGVLMTAGLVRRRIVA